VIPRHVVAACGEASSKRLETTLESVLYSTQDERQLSNQRSTLPRMIVQLHVGQYHTDTPVQCTSLIGLITGDRISFAVPLQGHPTLVELGVSQQVITYGFRAFLGQRHVSRCAARGQDPRPEDGDLG